MDYTTTSDQQASPPFQDVESFWEIKRGDGPRIHPEIHCKIVKGFFFADGDWTCYRRNYFSVECSYSFSPRANPKELFLVRPDGESALASSEQIQSFAVCLSACVERTPERRVELMQHTPKRDKGPHLTPQRVRLLPISTDVAQGINLPSPIEAGRSFPTGTYHAFERIQFRNATANNGKRRAAQQYYTIVVELWADTRPEGNPDTTWVKVAQRYSVPLVIRGRSPGHYRSEARIESDWRANADSSTTTDGYIPHHTTPILNSLQRWDEKKNAPTDAEGIVASASPAHTEQTSSEVERKQSENDHVIKDEKRSEKVVLDDSSVSSVENPGIGSRGPSSRSSFSSLQVEPSIADKFAKLLLESEGIHALSEGCFSVENEDRAERNIYRLLKILAINLKSAASNQVESVVAGLLLRHAKRVASSIRRQTTQGKSSLTTLQLLRQTGSSKEDVMDNFLLQLASTQEKLAASEEQGVASVEDVAINEETFNAVETEDEDGSDEEAGEPLSEPISMEIERGAHFLGNSEALVEFREGLIDFRVAVENARHNNQILHEKGKELLVELSWFQSRRTLASNLRALVWAIRVLWWWRFRDLVRELFHKMRKALRPRVKPGTRRIEWTCVSKLRA